MAYVKCPRCELNYMQDTERVCAVCKREMRGEDLHDEVEICIECGERPAEAGEELCSVCLKELGRRTDAPISVADAIEPEASIVLDDVPLGDMDSASNIEEIQIDSPDMPEDGEFTEIARELLIEEEAAEDEEEDM